MSLFLNSIRLQPQLVLASIAKRASSTAELAIQAGRWSCPLELKESFYGTGPETILECIRSLNNSYETVLLVGHEPTWSTLTSLLIGGGEVRLPTAGMAVVSTPIRKWKELKAGEGVLRLLVTPKSLRRAKLETEAVL